MAKPLMFDETGREIATALQRQNLILTSMLDKPNSSALTIGTMEEVGHIVKSGNAEKVFKTTDQIIVPCNRGGSTFDFVWNIAGFEEVVLENGERVPGMCLQAHHAIDENVVFDYCEAFYCNKSGSDLPAGTYYITVDATFGQTAAGNYYFTTTQPVPPNGKIAGLKYLDSGASYAIGSADSKIRTYRADGKTIIEENINISAGTQGTKLGNIHPTDKTGGRLNPLHYVSYGKNSWKESNIRQFLNSDAPSGTWWSSQHDFDITAGSTVDGFMRGFSQDFLNQVGRVKVTRIPNSAIESNSAPHEITYDKFFLPSLTEHYIQYSSTHGGLIEGAPLPYWKYATGLSDPMVFWRTYPRAVHYTRGGSARHCWLGSAYRPYGSYAWIIGSSGYVYGDLCCSAYSCAPLCYITGQY